MRSITIALVIVMFGGPVFAQQTSGQGAAAQVSSYVQERSNLPIAKVGPDDLVGITVYDSPELSRTVRIGLGGELRLPMLKNPIKAAGLYPAELETAISQALVSEQVMVDPIVTVTVVEYRSRPISVDGAVRTPVTFQGLGRVTLLDAIGQAQGPTDNAGSEVLVLRPSGEGSAPLVQRISLRALMDGTDPSLNIPLEGGDQVRIPEAGRVYVLGNVKKPGMFLLTDGDQTSVMKAIALSEGLDHYATPVAYIYRKEAGKAGQNEIPVELKKIMNRKSPDVALTANDILFIPDASGRRAALTALDRALLLGSGFGTTLLYLSR